MNVSVLLGLPERDQDRRYFVQCLQYSASQLSGFLTLDFWNKYVSRISTSSQVIQLAVSALGAQHETYMLSQDSGSHFVSPANRSAIAVYSLNNYQKAIKLLNARLHDASRSSQGVEEVLLACLLFICIELLRDDTLLALTHLEGGLGILSTSLPMLLESTDQDWKTDPLVCDLVKMFALMDMQTPSYITTQVCLPSMSEPRPLQVAAKLPGVTGSLLQDLPEALDSFNSLSTHIHRFVKTRAIPLRQQPVKFESAGPNEGCVYDDYTAVWEERQLNFRLLISWKERFEDLLKRKASVSELPLGVDSCVLILQEAIGYAVLWLTYFNTFIALSTCLEASETAFDGHLASFEAMLEHAHFILSASQQASLALCGSRLFSLQVKVVQPLYFVALKCREYVTRMEAIKLLRSICMKGAWGGEIEAAISGYVMYVEELQRGESCTDFGIPQEARIRNVEIVHVDKTLAHKMTQEAYETALATLDDLQYRLQRLEYFISGSDDVQKPLQAVVSKGREHSITARLAKLEHTLHSMSERSPVIHELLQLEAAHPGLFHPSDTDLDAVPSNLSTDEIAAIVTAHAPLYPLTASRLTSIRDINIPSSSLSTSLISLRPRLAKLEQLQDAQAKEMAELRARSAKAVQRWYELGVLGQGECWADWEGRMEACEKRVRRLEVERRREVKEKERYLT
ncbi:MAG: hypothetical protein Q9225_007081 [Loekoesia sp. 1 TL-2023]